MPRIVPAQNLVDVADAPVERVSTLEDMLSARRECHELR